MAMAMENRDPFKNWNKNNPLEHFDAWLAEAMKSQEIRPDAMTLATVSPDGEANARVVLFKGRDEQGIYFYTNYESTKSEELAVNGHAALVFYWASLDRQIRVRGLASKATRQQSIDYFHSRPRESQFGALASPQSRVIQNRQELSENYQSLQKQYADQEIPCPEHWGGYVVAPREIEFWCNGPHRLHDRLCYRKFQDVWQSERLAP